MLIPHDKISPQALRALVEEFVTRDGTDLSEAAHNIARIMRALEQGLAAIDYDEEEGTTNIIPIEPTPGKPPQPPESPESPESPE